MTRVLSVSDLSVRFVTDDGNVQAVTNLSFDLDEKEVLGVVGESGCGKSVTALSILGLLPQSADVSGTIEFQDRDLLSLSRTQLQAIRGRNVAMVFQEPMTSLNPVFTIGRQIAEVLQRHEGMSRKEARGRAEELLELVGIPAPSRRVNEYPHQLSGGMRQRVMIAMAVACGPNVLIADEPTTALDVTIQAGILDLLRNLRDELGTAILLITHDLGVVADIADRVVVMYAGQKVEEAAIDELFDDPQHPYTIGLMKAIPRLGAAGDGAERRLQEIPGTVPVLSKPATACAFAPRCPRADELTRSQVPELEEVKAGHRVACFHPGRDGEL